ncbi:MAG: TonB-dependent receptor [Odoribacteraceae bacterium]|jgi:TonB-linked SusC/RagA family outer membrane protein|nr:TonB-dependent receptor [Odoribacteraceae bacterium]
MKYKAKYLKMVGMLVILLSAAGALPAQQANEEDIAVTVKGDDGGALPGVSIVVGEGQRRLQTDASGQARFLASPGSVVTFRAPGFATVAMAAGEVKSRREVILASMKLYASEEDDLPLPFATIKKRYSVGGSVVIPGEALETFSSSDIRDALTGLASGVEVIENNGAPGMTALERIGRWGAGTRVSVNGRSRTLIYMLDGVPVDVAETPLDPREIESVTIVKDVVEKTLYGPFAAQGIVYIKTRTGRANDRTLEVNAEAGVRVVDRMPEYVNGVDYARLNNIARDNSSVEMLYTREDIEAYAKNDPYDMFHPNVNFKEMLLKNSMNYQRINVSSGGGSGALAYHAYLGYTGEGDILKIGPTAKYDRVNLHSNIDIKLNDFIKTTLGIFSSISYRKSPNYGYDADYTSEDGSTNSTLGVYEVPDVLGDIRTIPAISFPVYANNDPELASPWYAVSQLYTQNPVGNMLKNGKYTESTRRGLIRVAIDMDLSFLLKGLSATSFGSFDATNLLRIGTAENYDAYLITKGWDVDGNAVPELVKSSSHTVSDMANKVKLADYLSQRFFGSQKIAYRNAFGQHDIDAALTAFITKRTLKFITEHRREVTGTLSARYAYADRYLLQAALGYSGTYSLANNNRYAFSPSVGAGWILSEESFLANARGIDFLKIRAEVGLLHYDGSMSAYRDIDNFSWNNTGQAFGPHANNQWFGSTVTGGTLRVTPSLIGNPNLRLERRKEFSAGIEGLALNRRLSFEINYYNVLGDGPVTQVENVIPLVVGLGDANPWMNYNQTRYYGFEFALGFKDKVGEFTYAVDANAATNLSKVIRNDELHYPFAYMSRKGLPVNAIFGLKYAGKFQSDAETLLVPQLYDEELHAGDLKYEDMNGDGVIDDNDRCMIGNSAPKLVYSLRLNLHYKGFDLNVIGTGRAFYDIALTNDYFWNGWGDGNYSKFVLDTHDGGKYPKLSYYKVTNNYKTSDFWLEKGGFFKLQNVELGYSLPVTRWNMGATRGIRLYVKGSNLLTLSKIKEVDPESINSGVTSYPLFRSFVGGVKLTF